MKIAGGVFRVDYLLPARFAIRRIPIQTASRASLSAAGFETLRFSSGLAPDFLNDSLFKAHPAQKHIINDQTLDTRSNGFLNI